ncbi:hypothetical protein NECAME_02198, partial [Necator americanus]
TITSHQSTRPVGITGPTEGTDFYEGARKKIKVDSTHFPGAIWLDHHDCEFLIKEERSNKVHLPLKCVKKLEPYILESTLEVHLFSSK